MPDVEQQVAEARAAIAAAQSAKARAEHEHQVAQAQAQAAARELKDEFGVSSVQEARDLAVSLEAELEAECSAVRAALARVRHLSLVAGKGSS